MQTHGCQRVEEMGRKCLMGKVLYFGVTEMFWNQIEVMVAQHCECTKCH